MGSVRTKSWNTLKSADILSKDYDNSYSTTFNVGSGTTDNSITVKTFGFSASLLRVENKGSESVFMAFSTTTLFSTEIATTCGGEIGASGIISINLIDQQTGISFHTASTDPVGVSTDVLALG
jgi:hypothetical protein